MSSLFPSSFSSNAFFKLPNELHASIASYLPWRDVYDLSMASTQCYYIYTRHVRRELFISTNPCNRKRWTVTINKILNQDRDMAYKEYIRTINAPELDKSLGFLPQLFSQITKERFPNLNKLVLQPYTLTNCLYSMTRLLESSPVCEAFKLSSKLEPHMVEFGSALGIRKIDIDVLMSLSNDVFLKNVVANNITSLCINIRETNLEKVELLRNLNEKFPNLELLEFNTHGNNAVLEILVSQLESFDKLTLLHLHVKAIVRSPENDILLPTSFYQIDQYCQNIPDVQLIIHPTGKWKKEEQYLSLGQILKNTNSLLLCKISRLYIHHDKHVKFNLSLFFEAVKFVKLEEIFVGIIEKCCDSVNIWQDRDISIIGDALKNVKRAGATFLIQGQPGSIGLSFQFLKLLKAESMEKLDTIFSYPMEISRVETNDFADFIKVWQKAYSYMGIGTDYFASLVILERRISSVAKNHVSLVEMSQVLPVETRIAVSPIKIRCLYETELILQHMTRFSNISKLSVEFQCDTFYATQFQNLIKMPKLDAFVFKRLTQRLDQLLHRPFEPVLDLPHFQVKEQRYDQFWKLDEYQYDVSKWRNSLLSESML